MKSSTLLFLVLVAMGSSAKAQTAGTSDALKIRQVFSEKGRIIAESSDSSVAVDDDYVVTFENQKQCVLSVAEVKNKYVTLNTSACRYKDDLRAGMTLEKSLLPNSKTEPQASVPPVVPADVTSSLGQRNNLIDLGFMTPQSRLLLDFGLGRQTLTENDTVGGSNVMSIEKTTMSAQLRADYGIKDFLSVAITARQSLSDSSNYSYGPASVQNGVKQSVASKGMYDPSVEVIYRGLKQGEDPVSGFLLLAVKPSFGNAKSASVNSDGTQATGGVEYGVAAKLVYEGQGVQSSIQPSFTYRDKRKTDSSTGLTTSEGTGGDVMKVDAILQAKMSELLAFQIGATWHSIGDSGSQSPAAAKIVTSAYSYTIFKLGARGMLIPNRLMARVGLEFASGINTKISQGTTTLDVSASGQVMEAGISYLF